MRRQDGTAAVEMVLIAPALLLLLSVVVGGGRVVTTKSAVVDVAREAARAGAEASDPGDASDAAHSRAREVAEGLGLDPDRLVISEDAGSFARGAPYEVIVSYRVRLGDLPALGFLPGSFVVRAQHAELIDRFKSR